MFHDQRLTDAQPRDFAARLGPLEIGRSAAHRGRPHDERQARDLRRATTLDAGSPPREAA